MTPQQKRVLAAAKSFQGTCSADWVDGLGADGKGKITRVPARIEELADDYECVFECIGWRNKTKVFRLVSAPEGALTEVSASDEPATLTGSGPGPAGTPFQAGADASVSAPTLFEVEPQSSPHWKQEAA
jgi:hypothetical protein